MHTNFEPQWAPFLQRYKHGEWRSSIFRDMILVDAMSLEQERGKLTFLDIGCGGGFDSDSKLQQSLALVAGQYIGIEPDSAIDLGDIFSTTYRCFFEDAPIEEDSIDIAFAVMVLEHFNKPELFWNKLHKILKKGGVFWGFTVDARHLFVYLSLLTEKLHIKDLYLNLLHGKRGEERYENYGVYYRTNTPQEIEKLTSLFISRTILNFYRVGQFDYYFPQKLRWVGRSFDHFAISMGWPGSVMALRIEK
jgi:SAM-dependent methyltransferase